jgi:hypothetical protein
VARAQQWRVAAAALHNRFSLTCALVCTQEVHVVVATPQLLLNVLEAGAAHFSQLALLVSHCCRCCCQLHLSITASGSLVPALLQSWTQYSTKHGLCHAVFCAVLCVCTECGVGHVQVLDECHHAQADHSMAKVMRHYHKSERKTQVTFVL